VKAHRLLLILFLFESLNYSAQSGPTNLSFENWTTTAFGPSPSGWFGYNISKQSSGAQQGSNYVRIYNTSFNQGTMMLGTITSFTGPIKGGATYTQIPVGLSGFYKTSGMVSWDVVGLTANTSYLGGINASASFSRSSNTATWTSFSATFSIFNPGPVDSIFVVASSGGFLFGGGNNSTTAILDLDNISFGPLTNTTTTTTDTTITTTGLDVHSLGTCFLVYPNPASGELNIISKNENAVSVVIMGLDGRVINLVPMERTNTKIDLQQYENGLYFYTIQDKERNTLLTNKFVVSKQ